MKVGNFLPSEPSIRKEQAALTKHLSIDKVDCGKMNFKVIKNDKVEFQDKAYVRIKEILPFLNEIVESTEFRTDKEFENKVWILFSGDKGG